MRGRGGRVGSGKRELGVAGGRENVASRGDSALTALRGESVPGPALRRRRGDTSSTAARHALGEARKDSCATGPDPRRRPCQAYVQYIVLPALWSKRAAEGANPAPCHT